MYSAFKKVNHCLKKIKKKLDICFQNLENVSQLHFLFHVRIGLFHAYQPIRWLVSYRPIQQTWRCLHRRMLMLRAAHLPMIPRVQLQNFVVCTLLKLIAELFLLGRSPSRNSRNVQICGKKRKIRPKVRLHLMQIAMTGTVCKRLQPPWPPQSQKSKASTTENSSAIIHMTKGVRG